MAKSRYNIERLRKKFAEFDNIAKEDIKTVLSSSANIIVNNAKRKAPANYGKLKQSIGNEAKKEGLEQVVYVGETYGVFVEFGTKTYVKVPIGFESIAMKFKGYKSGDLDEFLENIRAWAKKKGIGSSYSIKSKNRVNNKYSRNNEDAAAFMIAMTILRKGIKPQPFIIPAFIKERDKIPKKMDKMLKRSARNFNKD